MKRTRYETFPQNQALTNPTQMPQTRGNGQMGKNSNEEEHEFKRKRRKQQDSQISTRERSQTKKLETPPNIVGPILYDPSMRLPDLKPLVGCIIEVQIMAKYLTKQNLEGKYAKRIGKSFSESSDILALIQETGNYILHESIPTDRYGIQVFLNVLQEDNSMAIGVGVDSIAVMEIPNPITESLINQKLATESQKQEETKFNSLHLPAIPLPEYTIISSLFPSTLLLYNLSQEPCFKYDFNLICDKGTDQQRWTSYCLKTRVLFLESLTERYELSKDGTQSDNTGTFDTYRWVKVLNPYHLDKEALKKVTVPLTNQYCEVLHQNLDWSEILWGHNTVIIKGQTYKIYKMYWIQCSQKNRT